MNKQERIDFERQQVAQARMAEATERLATAAEGVPKQPMLAAAPRFIQILVMNKDNSATLFGLKSDGTVWKSIDTSADPLVFTEVYPI